MKKMKVTRMCIRCAFANKVDKNSKIIANGNWLNRLGLEFAKVNFKATKFPQAGINKVVELPFI